MPEKTEFTINKGEDFRDFLFRVLGGLTDKDSLQLFVILLEIIVTELKEPDYTLSLSIKPQEIGIAITHSGRAIKESILNIIDDQVDHLRYQHKSRDFHVLKIRKKIKRKL